MREVFPLHAIGRGSLCHLRESYVVACCHSALLIRFALDLLVLLYEGLCNQTSRLC